MRLRVMALVVLVACGKKPAQEGERVDAGSICTDAGPPLAPRLAAPTGHWKNLTKAETDESARAFEARNGNRWEARVGAHGFLFDAVSTDPCAVPTAPDGLRNMLPIRAEDRARWTAFVLANGDYFGVDDAQALVWRALGPGEAEAVQVVEGVMVGRIYVRQEIQDMPRRATRVLIGGHFWSGLTTPPAPAVDPEPLRARFVGRPWVRKAIEPGPECNGQMPDCGPRDVTTRGIATKQQIAANERLGFVVENGAFTFRRVWEVRAVDRFHTVIDGLPTAFDTATGAEVKPCDGAFQASCAYAYAP